MNSNNIPKTKRTIKKTTSDRFQIKTHLKRMYLRVKGRDVFLCEKSNKREVNEVLWRLKNCYVENYQEKERADFNTFITMKPEAIPLIKSIMHELVRMEKELTLLRERKVIIEYDIVEKKAVTQDTTIEDFFKKSLMTIQKEHLEYISNEINKNKTDISLIIPKKPTKILLGGKVILKRLVLTKANHRLVANMIAHAHRFNITSPKKAVDLKQFFTDKENVIHKYFEPYVAPNPQTILENTKNKQADWKDMMNKFFLRNFEGKVFLNPLVSLSDD